MSVANWPTCPPARTGAWSCKIAPTARSAWSRSGVLNGPAVHEVQGEWFLTYVTASASDSASNGTLWLARGEDDGETEPIVIAENARSSPSAVTPDGGLLTVLDWASTGGRLVEWKGDALTDVADRVIEVAPLGRLENKDLTLLANFDGTTGDLLRLRRDFSTELLASRVPARSANADAFLANFDGAQGELRLLHRENGSSELLGSGVARGAYKFAQQFSAVMMLTERDADTNTSTLEIRLLDTGEDYVLNSGVTEAREVAFPNPGRLVQCSGRRRGGRLVLEGALSVPDRPGPSGALLTGQRAGLPSRA